MAVSAAAAAGTAVGVGGTAAWLFDYNRANFQFDAPRRLERFLAARSFANAQTSQYREDIHGFMEITVSKMEASQCVLTLFLCICAALSCAGRIGMHGAAPPSWLCALYSGHIFTALLYCGTALWLCFHASLRAQCAGVSLLTRKVRLPIPNMVQLDVARSFGCGFEKQSWRDILRVPFMRHPEWAPEIPPASDGDSEDGLKSNKPKEKRAKGGSDDPRAGFDSTARDTVPTWIRDEQVVDKGEGFPAAGSEPPLFIEHEAPEHFKLLQEAQEHWYQYDVYARIMMLFGVCNFLHAVSYYSIGTTISELRGFWIMWSLPLTFMAAQALIMRLDIVRSYTGHHMVPHLEWAGHLAPFVSIAACTVDYRYTFSRTAVICTWALVQLAFFMHLLMALRMIDLAWPDLEREEDLPDEAGKPWWPRNWKVPSAFARALWIIAPPNKLEPGVAHDLLHEMATLRSTGGGVISGELGAGWGQQRKTSDDATTDYAGGVKAFGSRRPGDLPWRVSRLAMMTTAFIWVYMMIANFVEMFIGPEALMKPPGEPPWIRDQKLRAWTVDMWHTSIGDVPEDYRLFAPSTARYDGESAGWAPPAQHPQQHAAPKPEGSAEGDFAPEETKQNETHSHHRRLRSTPMDELVMLLPSLDTFVQQLDCQPKAPEPAVLPQASFMAKEPKAELQWPPLFEPQVISCKNAALVALTSRGAGVWVQGRKVEAFAVEGVKASSPIVGSGWTSSELQLLTRAGTFLSCPGVPAQGLWKCRAADLPALQLPAGSGLLAAAVANGTVALQLETMPSSVVLFKHGGGGWSPTGLVHLPPGEHFHGRLSLSLAAAELLVTSIDGVVLRRSLADGGTSLQPPKVTSVGREFRGSCVQPDGSLLRLALRRGVTAGSAWTPELLV